MNIHETSGLADPLRPKAPEQRFSALLPVGWRYVPSDVWGDQVLTQDPRAAALARQYGREVEPLYSAAQLQAVADEVATLRSQLEHWKTFAIHAEGEHAAWKKTAQELDAELIAMRAATAEGRTYTRSDLLEAVRTERHACSICVWMVLQDALAPDADDKGLEGWMREAEARVKGRLGEHQ